MKKLLVSLLLISGTSLAGCSGKNWLALPDIKLPDRIFPEVYRIPVRQGNLVTQQMVNELEPGMTRQQVRFILGTPLLTDTFHTDRWDYLYTYQPGRPSNPDEIHAEKTHIKLHFENNRLIRIDDNTHPPRDMGLAVAAGEKQNERTVIVPSDTPQDPEDTGFLENLWGKIKGKISDTDQKK